MQAGNQSKSKYSNAYSLNERQRNPSTLQSPKMYNSRSVSPSTQYTHPSGAARDLIGDNVFIAETLASTNFLCCNTHCGYFGLVRTTTDYETGSPEKIRCPRCRSPLCAKCRFDVERVRQVHKITSTLVQVNADQERQKSYIKIFCCCGSAQLVSAKDIKVTKSVSRRLSLSFSRAPTMSEDEQLIDLSVGRCTGCDAGHKTCNDCVGLECSSVNSNEQQGEFVPRGSRTKRALSMVTSLRVRRNTSLSVAAATSTTPTSTHRDAARLVLSDMNRSHPVAPQTIPAPHFPGNTATATPWDFGQPANFVTPHNRSRFTEDIIDIDDGRISPVEASELRRGRTRYRRPVSPPSPM
jgi:hypothetical protein